MKTPWKITTTLLIAAFICGGCIKNVKEKLIVSRYSIEADAVQSMSITMRLEANFVWTIETTATWLNVSPQKSSGDCTIEIFVSPNTSLEPRHASFFIRGEETNVEIKVTQKGEAPAGNSNDTG